MNVELLDITSSPEELIDKCAHVCYNSKPRENLEARGKFIQGVIKRGHLSLLEHAKATFEISGVSRALSHQLVRHRLATYSQRSQRYVEEKTPDFVIPKTVKEKGCVQLYTDAMNTIWGYYNDLLQCGVLKEDARFVLPNACTTTICMSTNFSEWRHIIELRAAPDAQWEIQELARTILKMLYEHAPNVFGDLMDKFGLQR